LRGFFALLILDITGIATILIRQKFLTNDFENYLLVWVIISAVIIFGIMISYYIAINRQIKLLKQ